MSLATRSQLGPYEILAPLGAGGMGEVYRARDTRLGREVAVKVLPEGFASDAERRARFEREARAVAALSHPNVLALYDYGTASGTAYTVTELLEGETLRARLAGGALPWRRAVEIGIQVAHGLAAAHDKGIVHRDLKPENVWLCRDGRVKLLDFGLAKQREGVEPDAGSIAATAAMATAAGLVVGTAGYMSPEQVRGQAVDARTDLFALGAVLVEMLTGERAFQRGTAADTMSAILREEPAGLPAKVREQAPSLERIVARCLEKEPAARFQSAHDLAFALESALSPSAASGTAVAALAPARTWRSWLAPVLVLAAAALAIAAFVAGTTLGARRGSPFVFRQRTFGRQAIFEARFAPDARTVVISAARQGNTPELFVIHPDSPEPHPLGVPDAHLLAISSKGELAVLTGARYLGHHHLFVGTLARMPLEGGAPRALLDGVREADWSPDGSALAIIREIGGKDRLEYPIGHVLFETAGYLSAPRFSPDGRHIGFLEHPLRYDDRGTVNIVDLSGHARVLTRDVWGEEGLAWSPNGRDLLYSASLSGEPASIFAVDLAGHRRGFFSAPGQMFLMDVGPKGRWLLTREEYPLGISVRTPRDSAERDLSWLDTAIGARLSGDGRRLLFTDQGEMAGPHYNACVRGTDGSPIVRLGEGSGEDLSRDGSSVLSVVLSQPPRLMLYPTGAGDAVRLDHGELARISTAVWFADGRRALVVGAEPGRAPRAYVLDPRGGRMRPATPPGTENGLPSPDGHTVLASIAGAWFLYPLDRAGTPRRIESMSADDTPARWTPDGRGVLVYHGSRVPLEVDRVDVATGQRTRFAEIEPAERTGLVTYFGLAFSDDLATYAYSYMRSVATLYEIDSRR